MAAKRSQRARNSTKAGSIRDMARRGGLARARSLTPARRSEIARRAVQARLNRPVKRREHEHETVLALLARKYIWWELQGDESDIQTRVIAQVMDIGTLEDIFLAERIFGRARLRDILAQAAPGWFRGRSWSFWHYRLHPDLDAGEVPPLPVRSYLRRSTP